MRQANGKSRNRGLAMLSGGLLALLLALMSGAAHAAPDAAAWAFDLLARVEQWRPTGPLDFLPDVAKDRPVPTVAQTRIQAGYGRLPMRFEPNFGQTADEVKFVARGPSYTLFLTADEAVLALRPGRPVPGRTDPGQRRRPFDLAAMTHDDTPAVPGAVIRTRLEGATRNPAPQPEGLEKLPGISNYFLGNDPAKWRTHVPHYRRVRYPNVYPGIDLVYYGNPQRLEHDFIVAPGADPAAIQLAISGADQAIVNADGDLVLQVPGGEVVQRVPKIYQVIDGRQRAVAGRYALRDAAPGAPQTATIAAAEPAPEPLLVGFEVARYDRNQPLVIDPVLVYSTYLGGNDLLNGFTEDGSGIAVDGAGNAYVTGTANSADFPTLNALDSTFGGDNDAFVAKLNPGGTALIYSTYLGGGNVENGSGIAVDGAGNAYVTGSTNSADFPTHNALESTLGGVYDAFVVKLNPGGTALVYSTYLGGSGFDNGADIAVDGAGNAYLVGGTESLNFPTRNAPYPNFGGARDAFVAKLNPSGSALVYSTYLGGSKLDLPVGIAVDDIGNAYVTGLTYSTDFPTHNALYPNFGGGTSDAFIAKLTPDGSALVYSTYLGGSEGEFGRDIAVDDAGNAYFSGDTDSVDFPTVNALYPTIGGPPTDCSRPCPDAFVAKLTPDGLALVFSTYLGGSGFDAGSGIAVDGAGNLYLTGYTESADFPTLNALDPNLWEGPGDAFVVKLNPDGTALVYSTFLGGGNYEGGSGIAVDGAGNAYLVGGTESTDFPTRNAPYPNFGGGFTDAFVAKIGDEGNPKPTLTVTVAGSGSGGVTSDPAGIDCGATCSASFDSGTFVALTASPAGGSTFAGWSPASCGNPFALTADTTCTATFNRTNRPPVASAGPDRTVESTGPNGARVTLDGSASSDPDSDPLTFTWTGPFGTASGPHPTVALPLGTHTVTLTVADGRGGTATDTVVVQVRDTTPPVLSLPANISTDATDASGAVVTYTASATDLVDGAVTPNCTPASGSTFPIGATTVGCTATDKAANTASGSFEVTVVGTTPPSSTHFSTFSVNPLRINQRLNIFFLLSSFTLGPGSNGIDPTKEPVTLTMAGFTTTIPAGSFRKGSGPFGVYAFAGIIDGVPIQMLIVPLGNNRFGFQAAAYGVNPSVANNPVTVGLVIGNDSGTTSVKPVIIK